MRGTGSRSIRRRRTIAGRGGRLVAAMIALGVMAGGPVTVAHAAAGDLDSTFGVGGVASTNAGTSYAVAVQPSDGKIVTAGCQGVCGTDTISGAFVLQRFNTDGSPDATFGSGGVVTTSIGQYSGAQAVAIQPDGKILAAGCSDCAPFEGQSEFAVARYNPDGSLDRSFGSSGTVRTYVGHSADAFGVAVQSDGKIVVGGFTNFDFAVARYNPDGSLDTSFGNALRLPGFGGYVETSYPGSTLLNPSYALAYAMTLQPDGKIVLAGDVSNSSQSGAGVARYLPSGALDTSFGEGGWATMSFNSGYRAVEGVAVQADGRIVIAGSTSVPGTSADAVMNHWSYDQFAVGRFTASGTPDPSFGTAGKVVTNFSSATLDRSSDARGVAVQSDGKIVAAGVSTGGMGSAYQANITLARYLPSGMLDPTFGSAGRAVSAGGEAHSVALQSDGKILAAGGGRLARLLGG